MMDTPQGVDRLPDGPVRRMFAAAGQHDLEAMIAEFADDYVNITPNHPARSFRGRSQVRSNWSALFTGIPDLTVDIHDATTAPDGKIWVEWATRGTRLDGVPVEQAGVAVFTSREGRISAVRFYLEAVDHESGDVNTAVRTVAGVDSTRAQP